MHNISNGKVHNVNCIDAVMLLRNITSAIYIYCIEAVMLLLNITSIIYIYCIDVGCIVLLGQYIVNHWWTMHRAPAIIYNNIHQNTLMSMFFA